MWHPQHPVMLFCLKGGILCSKGDVKMSPSCSTILLLVHLSLIPAAKCKGSRHTKSAPNIILHVGNGLFPGCGFLRKHPILGAVNEHNSEGDVSLLGSNSFLLTAAGKAEIRALAAAGFPYAEPRCSGCTPFPAVIMAEQGCGCSWLGDWCQM